MDVEVGRTEYKGKTLCEIQNVDDDRFPFSFGLTKACLLKAALFKYPTFLDDYIEEQRK